jgi:WD40 repeat protein
MLAPNCLLQNRYLIVRPIGHGGMGNVYEATDMRLHATVALKETLMTDRVSLRAFEREAQLLARLRHPVLPKVIDHFMEDDGQFLVMEYIPGDDLAALMEKQGGAFPPAAVVPWALSWADQLLDALDYLHRQDPPAYHRDIKPQNLKLTARGQIILLDFGLAKGGMAESSTMTARGEKLLGFTPNYAPLEQIRGSDPDERSDLYSLAATLYHLMTGVKPPDALTRVAAVLNEQPDPLRPASEYNHHISPAVAAVLRQALSSTMEERPASASEMRRAFYEARQQSRSPQPVETASETERLRSASEAPEYVTDALDHATGRLVSDVPLATSPQEVPGTLLYGFQTASPVLALALNPEDGRLLAVGSNEGTIGLWDVQEEEFVRTLEGHSASVIDLAFSVDGTRLISGSEDRTVCVWRVEDGALLYQSGEYAEPIECVALSPDGRLLALGGWGEAVILCELKDERFTEVKQLPAGFVHSLAFSPDGCLLAAGCYDASVRLWHTETYNLERVLSGHSNFVLTVAFSPNSKMLASGGGETDIRVWRVKDGRLLDTLHGHTNFVRSLAFSPNSKLLASGSEDKTARLWRVGDGSLLHSLEGHTDGVTRVHFDVSGRILFSGSRDSKVRLWQAS